jgi:biopolymer transport protein ExbD
VTLVRSTATGPAPAADAIVVTIDAAGARLGGDVVAKLPSRDAWRQGFESAAKRSGPNDFLLVALHDRAKQIVDAGRRASAVLAVDGDIPYRPIVEVLFTLGQSNITDISFVVAGAKGTATIPITLPKVASLDLFSDAAAPDRPLSLTVQVGEGISIKTSQGNIAPGCKEADAGVAIPGRDVAAVAPCVSAVRAASHAPGAQGEHAVMYTSQADVSFSTLVGVLDALREASFDQVSFGIPR